MKCFNQCVVIVGSVVNAGMKIVKIVIWGRLGADRRTTDGGQQTTDRRMSFGQWGFFFFLWNRGILHQKRGGKDWLLQQHFHFLLLANVSSGYWWA
jgi:hypothetical protein